MSDDSDFFDSLIKSKANKKKKPSIKSENFSFLDENLSTKKSTKSESSDEIFSHYVPSKISRSRQKKEDRPHKSPPSSFISELFYNQKTLPTKSQREETSVPPKEKSTISSIIYQPKGKQEGGNNQETIKKLDELSHKVKLISDEIKNNNQAEISKEIEELSRQIQHLKDQAFTTDSTLVEIKQSITELNQNVSQISLSNQNYAKDENLLTSRILEESGIHFDQINQEIGRLRDQVDSIKIPDVKELISELKDEILEEIRRKDDEMNNSYIFLKKFEDLQLLIKSCLINKEESTFNKNEMGAIVGLLDEINSKLTKTLNNLTTNGEDQVFRKTVTKNLFDYQWLADRVIKDQKTKFKKMKHNKKPTNIKPVKVDDVIKYHGQLSSDLERMGTIMRMKTAAASAKSFLEAENIFLNSL